MESMNSLVSQVISKVPSPTTPRAFKECCICGKKIELTGGLMAFASLDMKCNACCEMELRVAENKEREKREAKIERMMKDVPSSFTKTDISKLPRANKLEDAMRVDLSQKGILLYGPTRCGKSRIAWEVIKREIAKGRTVKCVNSFSLAKYPAMIMSDFSAANAFAEEMASVSLLLLDDVFKAKQTERIEELLFGVIDERGQWERPCIITLNDTGETLESRMSQDRGPALVARLREYCELIAF